MKTDAPVVATEEEVAVSQTTTLQSTPIQPKNTDQTKKAQQPPLHTILRDRLALEQQSTVSKPKAAKTTPQPPIYTILRDRLASAQKSTVSKPKTDKTAQPSTQNLVVGFRTRNIKK